jgi:hypothetical protein
MDTHAYDFFRHFPAGQGTALRRETIVGLLQVIEGVMYDIRPYRHGVNIYARRGPPPPDEALLLEAHYDVANVASENCTDNTAGICHLLALLHNPAWTGAVSFTDGEELVSLVLSGAVTLADDLDRDSYSDILGRPKVVACLDVVSRGEVCFADCFVSGLNVDTVRPCPANDAALLRECGIDAVCVCLVPAEQADDHFPEHWRLCHQLDDTFANASKSDMDALTARLAAGLLS